MQFPQHVLTPAKRVVLTVAPFTLAALLASPAEAAGPRPFFQMPVACGQTWEASTYDGHWPDQDSIDLGEWTTADANMSKGEPVLASADGKVLDVFTNSAGDIRVYLDHGGGWVTHYIHLEQVPPLVKEQKVAQGEQIGRVGNSGTEAVPPSLHPTGRRQRRANRLQRHADQHARRQPGARTTPGAMAKSSPARTAR